jgi:drug/metabolite transporter (DMT)-like permease
MTDNLKGALLMVLAMAGFAVEDMALKAAAGTGIPVGQVLMLFGAGGTLGFALPVRLQGRRLWHPAMASRAVAARAAAEVTGRLFHTLALAYATLSSTSAILQAAPLVVVAGAALLFGEKVGWRRWLAIGLGFAGVLMILRPGLDGFQATSVLAVLGMLGFAGRDLATRAAPKVLSNMQLGVLGFAVLVPTGAGFMLWEGGWVTPGLPGALALAGGTTIGIAAYAALTGAMRTGEVSVVTPFRYTRLVFGVGLGVLVFGEALDGATLLGAGLILAAGLYTMLRERRGVRAGPVRK